MKKRTALASLALLFLAPVTPSLSQNTPQQTRRQTLVYNHNPGAAYEYCRMTGQSNAVFDVAYEGRIKITTNGSSTTTSALVASSAPFLGIDVGDELIVNLADSASGKVERRSVVTNADDDTVTVNAAWTLSPDATTGRTFRYKLLACGTGADDGAIGTDGYKVVRFDVQWTTKAAASLEILVQGRDRSGTTAWSDLATDVLGAVGTKTIQVNQLVYEQMRIGIKVSGDSGDQAVTIKVAAF